MKTLETEFTKQGFHFRQVVRDGDWALYEKRKPSWSKGNTSYEVFRIQRYKDREIAGKKIPASEAMPSNEQWGSEGFTFRDLQKAKDFLFARVAADQSARICGAVSPGNDFDTMPAT